MLMGLPGVWSFSGRRSKQRFNWQALCARVLMLSAAGDDGGGLGGFEVVAVADDYGGADEQEEAGGDEEFGAHAGAAPLLQDEAPEGGEDDDAGHVEGPGGEVVLAHLGLAHGVEEELEVPDDSGEGGEEVVGDEGLGGDAVVGAGVEWVEVYEGVAGGVGGAHGVDAGFAGELFYGAVFEDEDGGPDEVGEEASPEDDDEDGEIGPEVEAVVGDEFGLGDFGDGGSGVEAEGEEGAHDSGEDGDGDAFAEVVVGLAGFGLFFGGDFVFFGLPAAPLTATPMTQTATPRRMIWPEVWCMMVPIWPWKMGGMMVPKAAQRPRAMA